mgnify:CR=1 FL=1
MDIPLALEYLTGTSRILPTDDWGSSAHTGDSYAAFAAGWRGVSAVPTQAEMDAAWTAIEAAGGVAGIEDGKGRTDAKALYDSMRVLRALVLVLLGENNVLRQRDRDRATDVAGSGSLAALKTAWAARAPLADRTAAQARTAIRSAIDADA